MANYRETYKYEGLVQTLDSIETDATRDSANASVILPTISILLFLLFGALIFWITQRDSQQEGIRLPCPSGLCVTDVVSGEKVCPLDPNDQLLVRNPVLQACNVGRSCNDPSTPFLYFDRNLGSVPITQSLNVCPDDIAPEDCGCTSFRWCPDFASTFFQLEAVNSGGAGSSSSAYDKNVFVQKTVWTKPSNVPSSAKPIGLTQETGSNLSCSLGFTNLENAWPPLGTQYLNGGCVSGVLLKSLIESGNTANSGVFYCAEKPPGVTCGQNQIYTINEEGTYGCQEF